jgi:transcriptional regulator with XRE-family HTH domain
MSETFHDRVLLRISALGTSPRAVSVSAGLDPGYVGKLLKRRSMPNSSSLSRIADAMSISVAYLLTGDDEAPIHSVPSAGTVGTAGSEVRTIFRDLPLRRASSLLRGDGRFHLPAASSEMLFRPPALGPFANAYAFVIPNASLRPLMAPGSLAVACPEKPPACGDAVIVHLRAESGLDDCLIGILADDIGRAVTISLHGQETPSSHETAVVAAAHKILSLAEILGAGQ